MHTFGVWAEMRRLYQRSADRPRRVAQWSCESSRNSLGTSTGFERAAPEELMNTSSRTPGWCRTGRRRRQPQLAHIAASSPRLHRLEALDCGAAPCPHRRQFLDPVVVAAVAAFEGRVLPAAARRCHSASANCHASKADVGIPTGGGCRPCAPVAGRSPARWLRLRSGRRSLPPRPPPHRRRPPNHRALARWAGPP